MKIENNKFTEDEGAFSVDSITAKDTTATGTTFHREIRIETPEGDEDMTEKIQRAFDEFSRVALDGH